MPAQRQRNQQPGEQMEAVGEMVQLARAQPVLAHQLAGDHRQRQSDQGCSVRRSTQAKPTERDGIQAEQQGDGPEQNPKAAVQIDPLTGWLPGQTTPATIMKGIDDKTADPEQRHEPHHQAVQKPQQRWLIRACHSHKLIQCPAVVAEPATALKRR